jgi:hypothetical protein
MDDASFHTAQAPPKQNYSLFYLSSRKQIKINSIKRKHFLWCTFWEPKRFACYWVTIDCLFAYFYSFIMFVESPCMYCILNVFDVHSHFKSLCNICDHIFKKDSFGALTDPSILFENDTKTILLNVDSLLNGLH